MSAKIDSYSESESGISNVHVRVFYSHLLRTFGLYREPISGRILAFSSFNITFTFVHSSLPSLRRAFSSELQALVLCGIKFS